MHARRRVAVGTCAAALIIALAGCDGGGGGEPTPTEAPGSEAATPTPSATPSPTPTAVDERAANIEEAQASLERYLADSARVANAGGEGWEEIATWWGTPEIQARKQGLYEQMIADGLHTEGTTAIASMTITEYVEDPTNTGFEQVRIEYCNDASSVTLYDRDGNLIESQVPDRFLVSVTLQRQGHDGIWSINEETSHTDQTC